MESVASLVFSAENIRMLVLLVFGFCGYVLMKTSLEKKIDSVETSLNKRIDGVETSLNKRMDGLEKSMYGLESSLLRAIDEKISNFHAQLKANDFKHLNDTIEALTFTLEKNGYLKREDKEYIDGRLDK